VYYKGSITLQDVRQMPNRTLLSYMNAANTLSEMSEPEPEGLTGDAAIEAMKNDPAFRKT
jgi:hypothetical protein